MYVCTSWRKWTRRSDALGGEALHGARYDSALLTSLDLSTQNTSKRLSNSNAFPPDHPRIPRGLAGSGGVSAGALVEGSGAVQPARVAGREVPGRVRVAPGLRNKFDFSVTEPRSGLSRAERKGRRSPTWPRWRLAASVRARRDRDTLRRD